MFVGGGGGGVYIYTYVASRIATSIKKDEMSDSLVVLLTISESTLICPN